jgi:hypothetical protein
MRGPIDYIIVQFPGNHFKGEILRELNDAIESKTIALLDLSLISKDANGDVSSVEVSDPNLFRESLTLEPTTSGLISDEDIAEVGELLETNCSAGLLVIEHLWAKGLKSAILGAGGELVADGRIHPEAYAQFDEGEV